MIKNARLRWMALAGALSLVDLVVFIGCLRAENSECTAIAGIIGVFLMCTAAWHGLIYIAAKRGGF